MDTGASFATIDAANSADLFRDLPRPAGNQSKSFCRNTLTRNYSPQLRALYRHDQGF
jgi:hypothetical protein